MMDRQDMTRLVIEKKIISIVRGVYGEECLTLTDVLYEAGVRLIEVAYDHTNAQRFSLTNDTIRLLSRTYGGRMLVGAGTVTSVDLVEAAHDAGASFIVSPDTRVDVIRKTRELQMLSMPGALTPTEIGLAYDSGGDFIKVFPAGALGTAYFSALRAPLRHIPLLAVGNIGPENAADFLKAGAAGLGIGSSLERKDLLRSGRLDLLLDNAKKICGMAGIGS